MEAASPHPRDRALPRLRARGARPLRLLLVQLPVQELVFRRVRGNELVAPGYLAAMARSWAAATGHARDLEVEVLPREVVDRLGDAALARAIAAREPHVLGFSCFLWSSARSVALAGAVKRLLPDVAVVLGGPELTRDNPWLVSDPAVDLGVVGEGERTLCDLLAWLQGEGPAELETIAGLAIPGPAGPVFTAPRPATDLAGVPSPYLTGTISPAFDGAMGVETLRGCPFRCSFCYYYKQFAKVNAFPRGWLQAHFRYAREHGVRELVFLDPTLNARPRFSEFLDEVIAANAGGALELHAELVADAVDEKIADKLARANFKGVECGLQSTNERALAAVERRCDLERFARGVTLMDRRGITVKTDLIIGLPEDDEASVRRSIAWVRERELDADVQVFHLMVLPGTELREKAATFGYERLERPPYYATRTRWLDEDAMRRLIAHAGQVFEVDFDPPARPLLGAPVAPDSRTAETLPGCSGYWSRTVLDASAGAAVARARGRAAASSAGHALTVVVLSRGLEGEVGAAAAFLEEVVGPNPFATVDVVLDAPGEWPLDLLPVLKDAAATPRAYLNGYHRFQVPPGSLVSTRVSALVDLDAGTPPRARLDALEALVPVTYALTASSWREVGDLLDRHPGQAFLLGRSGPLAGLAPADVVAKLLPRLGDDPDALSFRAAADAREWDRASGREAPEAAPPEVELRHPDGVAVPP